jgi:CheY-like chemotaxis protein/anti-sigma regulatory factor (Ser/Thr protein kinase)
MARVLVAEDSRTQAMEVWFLLHEAGHMVETTADGQAALEVLARTREGGAPAPDVVLTDLAMPRLNGLELVEVVRRDYPGIPVVLMTALGSEEVAVKALQAGAASYVPKRNLARDIVPALERVLAVAQTIRHQQRVLESLVETSYDFVLENDSTLVAPLLALVEETLARLHPDRTERVRLGIALHEAVLNAIYHGNLEVSSELRQDDEGIFHARAEARRREEPYAGRRVRVGVRLSRAETTYVVQDEGPGFDPQALPNPADPANIERIGGRGLLLIRTFMDEVYHDARGSTITMVKRHGTKTGGRP